MLETGKYASISEIGTVEKIDRSYVGAILRLTLLAADIVEAVMNGRQPPDLAPPRLLDPFPMEWGLQRAELGFTGGEPSPRGARCRIVPARSCRERPRAEIEV